MNSNFARVTFRIIEFGSNFLNKRKKPNSKSVVSLVDKYKVQNYI